MDAAHLGGMVRDMIQGGEEKCVRNSVNICSANPHLSQNHVLTLLADLGQGSPQLGVFLYLTKLSKSTSSSLAFDSPLFAVPSSLVIHERSFSSSCPLSTRCNLLQHTVPDVRRFLLLLPILFFCRNPMLTPFFCVPQPTTTSLFLSASKFHRGLLKRVNPIMMKKKLRRSLTTSAQLFLIDLWQRISRKCARLHGTEGSCRYVVHPSYLRSCVALPLL